MIGSDVCRLRDEQTTMGAWGAGPFDNDDARDFLDTLEASPSRGLTTALRRVAGLQADAYVEVDVGSAAWAACEIVALSFGMAADVAIDDSVVEIVRKVRAQEAKRLLALSVLPRIADRETSELAGLWHEAGDGAAFDNSIAHLAARLREAAEGARVLPVPKAGDVLVLPANTSSDALIVVQVAGAREVAVFEGTCTSDAAALLCVKERPARRVLTSVSELCKQSRLLGNAPMRKELRGRKFYASESAPFEGYSLMTASAGGYVEVPYDEARSYDADEFHGPDEVRAVAQQSRPISHVRSPDVREAVFCAENSASWAERRAITTPSPFGDAADLKHLLEWMQAFGVENAVRQFRDLATGLHGYGRPNERGERRSYAFAGLVALWRGTWPDTMWPSTLGEQPPPRPTNETMAHALEAARILADRVVTRDAELRLIWDGAPDGGAAFRKIVASLQAALTE
jgi:hypothetical protein